MRRIYNYINGKLVKPSSNLYIDVVNPATGKVYTKAPDSNEKDVKKAIKAAHEAFDEWSEMSINARSRYLIKIADLIYENRNYLAKAESKDNGKPLWLAKAVDIPRASANFRFFGQAITQFASESHETNQDVINYTLRRPLGVVSCISPWNLPLYLFTWKIAPALAAGNTVVAKPSEITPMTAFLLADICKKAKLPKGVLNIIHGYGHKVGPTMTTHNKVKAVSFTGSTKTGAEIAKNTAPLFKKLSLEMGGKNPNIIFADCDYDKMLSTTIRSSFANQGQICLCGSRIYVEKKIYNKFKKDFVAKAKSLKVGDPFSPKSNLGAVVSKEHYEKVLSYIDLAKEEGGKLLCGGKASLKGNLKGGYYIKPTIIEGLAPTCRTNQEEIFGPVVTLVPFTKEEEVIHYANDISYGLSATIWTENLSRAHYLAGKIEAGIVWINTWLLRDLRTPFGGVKNSGIGREGGFEALRFFTEPKNICIDFSHHPD